MDSNPYDAIIGTPDAAPKVSGNPYDSLIPDNLDEQRVQAVRANVTLHADTNPDTIAAQRQMAKYVGVPSIVGEELPDVVKAQATTKRIETNTAGHPVLQQAYTDADFMRIGHDDSGALSTIANIVKFMASDPTGEYGTLGTTLHTGLLTSAVGVHGALRAVSDLGASAIDPNGYLDRHFPEIGGNPLRRLAEGFGMMASEASTARDALQPKDNSIVGGGIRSGVESAVGQAKYLPFLLAGPVGAIAALVGMSAEQGGQTYQTDREKGVGQWTALAHGTADAAIEYATEKLPVHMLLGDLSHNAPIWKVVAHQMAAEIPGEQIATAAQDLNEWAVLHPEQTFGDYLSARPAAAAQTLIATLIGVGGNIAAGKAIDHAVGGFDQYQMQVQRAEADGQSLTSLFKAAAESKLRERDPDTFAGLIQQMAAHSDTAPKSVFIDASALTEELGKAGITEEAFNQLVPGVQEQMAEARATGGAIELPIGDVTARIVGTPLEQSLLPHIRTTADSLSMAEAKDASAKAEEFLKQEASRAATASIDATAARTSSDAVHAKILEQLTQANRNTADVNEQYAKLVASFYTATSARLGMTPEQMHAAYPLQVTGAPIEGLNQGRTTLPSPSTLNMPNAPTAAQMVEHARTEMVPLAKAVSFQAARQWDKFNAGEHPGELIAGYGDKPVALKLNTGEYVVYDGNHRADLALQAGKADMKMHVIDVKDYDPQNAGRKPVPGNAEDDDALFRDLLAQETRGTFSPKSLTISLLEQANLSTFLHESGHFFLHVMGDLATQSNASPELVADFDKVLHWFGVRAADGKTAAQVWQGMTLDEQRPYHERWAESFEQYLLEGKAPTLALRQPFQRFRGWLVQVYTSLKDFAAGRNLAISGEIRAVMDRLIATQQDIEEAEQQARYEAIYKSAEDAGMDEHEWAVYQEMHKAGTDAAIDAMQARSLADLKWAAAAHSKAIRKAQAEVEDKRKAMREEVSAEVKASPLEQARARIAEIRKSTPEDKAAAKAWKEQRAGIVEQAVADGKAALFAANPEVKGIKRGQLYAKNKRDIAHAAEGTALEWEKSNPRPVVQLPEIMMDSIAEEFGYTSGDELARDMVEQPTAKDAIDMLTEQRLLAKYGDLVTEAGIRAAALQAVHNEARARFVATELATMQAALDQKEKIPGRKASTNALVAAAKQFADAIVGRRKISELNPGKYTAAETRAARAVQEAMAKGKTAEAVAAQRDRLLNLYAAKRTMSARTEVQKGIEYLAKFAKESARKSLSPDYLDQIDQMLEKFDLRVGISQKEIARRKSLAEWIQSQEAIGIEPNIPQELIDASGLTSYKDMSVDDFRALVDTIKQIEHLGRLKNKLLTAKDQREFDAVVKEVSESIHANAGDRHANARTPTSNLGRSLQAIKNFGSAHIKAATWARILDGGKDAGAVWEYLIRPANAAGDMETSMRAAAAEKLHHIVDPWVAKGSTGGKGKFFAGVTTSQDRKAGRLGSSFNRESILAIALNTGNESNLQRLLGGEGWTEATIKPLLDTLDASDWDVVQGVWDHFESYRPLIGAKEKRVFGREPDWIAPRSRTVTLPDGTIKTIAGGYYPVKFDPAASVHAEEHADAEGAKRAMQGAYSAATTRRSFTKTRVEAVEGRPLLYTLSGLYSGVNDVIHDLSWHEWLIDANRLMKNGAVDGAIREHYGPAAVRQFKTWRDAVAEGDSKSQAEIDGALSRLRQGVSIAGLGFNVMSALMQPLGMTQSVVRIGARWAGSGIKQYIADPVAATKDVHERSEFMASRARTRFRELNEIRNNIQGQSKARAAVTDTAYFLMMQCQQMVDVPTWLGAYEKAISEGHDDARAVALSDQAVIDAQGGGQTKDLSAIERGGPAQKLFTVFYSFMNTALNLGVGQASTAAKTPKGRAKLAADMLLLYVTPAILGAILKDALTPGDSGDYDDWKKLSRKLLGEQLTFILGLMVVSREFGEAGKALFGLSDHPRDYAGPAGVRMVSDAGAAAKQIQQGQFDDQLRKSVINLVGDLAGLPAAQINRTITGAKAIKEGKTKNPAALVLGYQEPH